MRNDSKPLNYLSHLDEDSHANMHCAGANFAVLKYSGYQYDVDPFLDSYQTTTGVDVVTAATAMQLTAGNVIYIISMATLWFGNQMETSLFNCNIARDAGIDLCTDPHDPHRDLSIHDRAWGLFIPMQRHGNFIGLQSYKPNPDDVLHAIANDDHNVIYLNLHAEYELPTHEHRIQAAYVSGIDISGDDLHSDDTDSDFLTLRQISTSLDPSYFACNVVASVNISDIGSSIITERHSSVTPERISKIFGCSIQTAKDTLCVTTQHGVQSAVHLLTHRYRTDLLLLCYHRLDTLMYSDTMHFKVKSLAQHTCTQMFATNDYIRAYPVYAEWLIPETLHTLAKDVGVPRELLTDNTNVMTGPEVEFNKQAQFPWIKMYSIKPHAKKQNKGEHVIGEL